MKGTLLRISLILSVMSSMLCIPTNAYGDQQNTSLVQSNKLPTIQTNEENLNGEDMIIETNPSPNHWTSTDPNTGETIGIIVCSSSPTKISED